MIDRTEPYWRFDYALPTPLLKIPEVPSRSVKDDPGALPPRKAIVPAQTRTAAHAPSRQSERWDLALPNKTATEL